jgi:hypothetical protein
MTGFRICLANRGRTVTNHDAEGVTLTSSITEALSDPLGMVRTLQWLGTASRDQFGVSSVGDDLRRRRAEGILEVSIAICKQLRTRLGDDPSIGYPNDQFLRVMTHLVQEYDCMRALSWATAKARS